MTLSFLTRRPSARGGPGLLLALVVLLFLREPSQRRAAEAPATPARLPAGAAMREIFGSRAFVYILIAASVTAFLGYGKALWTISFFIRSHGLSTPEAGLSMAGVLGLAAVFGTWLGCKADSEEGRVGEECVRTCRSRGWSLP